MQENYYKIFFEDVIQNNKWRSSIDISNGWVDRMDIVNKYQKYHKPVEDQKHMNKYFDLYKTTKYESAIHACIHGRGKCSKNIFFDKYEKLIKFKNFVKIITYLCIDFEGTIGIVIDNNFAFCCTWPGGFTIMNINHLNGTVEISKLTDFTIFGKITSIIDLIKNYGDIILF